VWSFIGVTHNQAAYLSPSELCIVVNSSNIRNKNQTIKYYVKKKIPYPTFKVPEVNCMIGTRENKREEFCDFFRGQLCAAYIFKSSLTHRALYAMAIGSNNTTTAATSTDEVNNRSRSNSNSSSNNDSKDESVQKPVQTQAAAAAAVRNRANSEPNKNETLDSAIVAISSFAFESLSLSIQQELSQKLLFSFLPGNGNWGEETAILGGTQIDWNRSFAHLFNNNSSNKRVNSRTSSTSSLDTSLAPQITPEANAPNVFYNDKQVSEQNE